MKSFTEIKDLFIKYIQGTATSSERIALSELLEQSGNEDEEIIGILESILQNSTPDPGFKTENWEPVILDILAYKRRKKSEQARVIRIPHWKKYVAAAACAILLFSAGTYFLQKPRPIASEISSIPLPSFKKDVSPGGNKATLTLANGNIITLDSVANGVLTTQGNIQILKPNGGQLVYNNTNSEKPTDILYNTVSTPKGGQYQIVLPDGTHAWLNSASTLRFPTAFSGKQREVMLSGEGYFEVTKNASMPFVVEVGEMKVKVLGTHFNIMAYPEEEAIKTTLLEGSVAISQGTDKALIVPGEQAQLKRGISTIKVLKNADMEEAVAWKNGSFYFNGLDIASIMRQVSRWYDVDVTYDGKIPEGHYKGKPSRNLSLLQMLKVVEYSGVKFKVEGKKIIVMH